MEQMFLEFHFARFLENQDYFQTAWGKNALVPNTNFEKLYKIGWQSTEMPVKTYGQRSFTYFSCRCPLTLSLSCSQKDATAVAVKASSLARTRIALEIDNPSPLCRFPLVVSNLMYSCKTRIESKGLNKLKFFFVWSYLYNFQMPRFPLSRNLTRSYFSRRWRWDLFSKRTVASCFLRLPPQSDFDPFFSSYWVI